MSDDMRELEELAEEQAAAEAKLEAAEKQVYQCKKALADVAEKRLPEAMEKFGLTKFETAEGLIIKVTETLRANITKENTAKAMAWLRDNDHAAIIKRTLTVIARDDAQGDVLAQVLSQFDMADKPKVHAGTLSKMVRELLEDGEEVPQEIFSIHRQRKSVVK